MNNASNDQQQRMNNVQPYQQQILNFKTIPKIKVIVRKRPLNKKESMKNDVDVVEIRNENKVVVKEQKLKVDLTKYIEEHSFLFDEAYNETATNEQIYLRTVRPMIEAAFHGYKVTCFAYGQTGSGKTYTMMGYGMNNPGIYLYSASDIFSYLHSPNYNQFSLSISFYEIYCQKLYDLLNSRNELQVREDGNQNICVVGITEKKVENLETLMGTILSGLSSRTTGVTGANNDSSRSHAIIQINIKDQSNENFGKISFIDLAGSERAADVKDTGKQTRIDGAEINKSLLALKECFRALDQVKKHTPFRGSKLTLVLRDSFIGDCKTLMIANISPALGCSEHTLNTLRYADRVKELRAKGNVNIGPGNINLNFNANNNAGKDPQELFENALMMPRQHGKTVKYNVDKNNKKLTGNNKKNNNINNTKMKNNIGNKFNSNKGLDLLDQNQLFTNPNNMNFNSGMLFNFGGLNPCSNNNFGNLNNNNNNNNLNCNLNNMNSNLNINNNNNQNTGFNNFFNLSNSSGNNNNCNLMNQCNYMQGNMNNNNSLFNNNNNYSNNNIANAPNNSNINLNNNNINMTSNFGLNGNNNLNLQKEPSSKSISVKNNTNSNNSILGMSQNIMENKENYSLCNNQNIPNATNNFQKLSSQNIMNIQNNSQNNVNSNNTNYYFSKDSFNNNMANDSKQQYPQSKENKSKGGQIIDANELIKQYENAYEQLKIMQSDIIEYHKNHIDQLYNCFQEELNVYRNLEMNLDADDYCTKMEKICDESERLLADKKKQIHQFKEMIVNSKNLENKLNNIGIATNITEHNNDNILNDINMVDNDNNTVNNSFMTNINSNNNNRTQIINANNNDMSVSMNMSMTLNNNNNLMNEANN